MDGRNATHGATSSRSSRMDWDEFNNSNTQEKFEFLLSHKTTCTSQDLNRMVGILQRESNYAFVISSGTQLNIISQYNLTNRVRLAHGLSTSTISLLTARANKLHYEVLKS